MSDKGMVVDADEWDVVVDFLQREGRNVPDAVPVEQQSHLDRVLHRWWEVT